MLGFFFFFFVKGFTVLNRYQTNINLRPKKPSTILGTQYFLVFYKFREVRENLIVLNISMGGCGSICIGANLWKTLNLDLISRKSVTANQFITNIYTIKSLGVKKSVLQQKAKRNLGPNPKWVIKYTHTTENKYLKLSFILYKLH